MKDRQRGAPCAQDAVPIVFSYPSYHPQHLPKVGAYLGVGVPTRGGKTPSLTKVDFSQQSAIFLQPEAQFDHLVYEVNSIPEPTSLSAMALCAMSLLHRRSRFSSYLV